MKITKINEFRLPVSYSNTINYNWTLVSQLQKKKLKLNKKDSTQNLGKNNKERQKMQTSSRGCDFSLMLAKDTWVAWVITYLIHMGIFYHYF